MKQSFKGKNVIVIPFAFVETASSGVNIRSKNKDIYLKNAFVALCSAKQFNPDAIVLFASNVEPSSSFLKDLTEMNINYINIPFSYFRFPNDYKWCLAFYKLNVLKYLERFDFKNLCLLDTDVYVRKNLDPLWLLCDTKIVLYDLKQDPSDSNLKLFMQEILSFCSINGLIHVGGEFYSSSIENLKIFNKHSMQIFNQMIAERFVTSFGDEFITSVVANSIKQIIDTKCEEAICRCWTGTYRRMPELNIIKKCAILHVPAEKQYGMLKLYQMVRKSVFPVDNKLFSILHISRPSILTRIKLLLKRILRR